MKWRRILGHRRSEDRWSVHALLSRTPSPQDHLPPPRQQTLWANIYGFVLRFHSTAVSTESSASGTDLSLSALPSPHRCRKFKPLIALLIISANPVSILAPFVTILVPMKEKISKFSAILDHEPRQVSNMEYKIIGRSGQMKRLGDLLILYQPLSHNPKEAGSEIFSWISSGGKWPNFAMKWKKSV